MNLIPIRKRIHDLAMKPPEMGFSLVELMVAMLIGLIILAAVVQIFVGSNATYRLDEGLARVQEGARFSMDYLAKDIRMAGYMGCNSKLSGAEIGNIVKNPNQSHLFSSGGIFGYRYICAAPSSCTGGLAEWEPPLPSDYFGAGEVRMGSDVIVINRGSELGTSLTGNLSPSNANIKVVATAAIVGEIKDNDILMVSDCKAADIFRVTNINPSSSSGVLNIVHAGTGNTAPPLLTHKYGDDARLMKLVTRVYYVGASATPGETSLFRKELGTGGALNPEELVEGVEALKILYGIDTAAAGTPQAGIPARYIEPKDVVDGKKVVSVRLGMVVRTPGFVDTALDTKIYDVLDDTTSALDNFDPPDDNRRRRVFNSTIRLRNH